MGSHYSHLTLDERRLIFRLWEAKAGIPLVAARLGRHRATICREIRRNWYDDAEASPLMPCQIGGTGQQADWQHQPGQYCSWRMKHD